MSKLPLALLSIVLLIGTSLLISQTLLHSTIKTSSEHTEKISHKHGIVKQQGKFASSNNHHHSTRLQPIKPFVLKKASTLELKDDFVTVHPQDPILLGQSFAGGDDKQLPENDEDWFPDGTEKISVQSRKHRWSEPALLKNYDRNRKEKACDMLPSNITFEQDESIVLGEVSITRMPEWRRKQLRRHHDSSSSSSGSSNDQKCTHAFVLMVSNHKYVDGALVMAQSLWNTSAKLKQGEFCLVMLTSDKLHHNSLRQLSLFFDVVKALRTLGTFVPKSYYAPTFDKAYLWSLVEYEHVMFLDADHFVNDATQLEELLLSGGGGTAAAGSSKRKNSRRKKKQKGGDENNISESSLSSSSSWPENRIVAVGDHGYFQTGLMILKPNMNIFVDLYLEFRYGKFGYNQWRARDGILIRNCFLKSNDGISHPSGVFHFYGYFKPWFDFRKSRKITKEPIDFGTMYHKWWSTYEQLHLGMFQFMPLDEGLLYGGGRKSRRLLIQSQSKRKFFCQKAEHANDPNYIDPACFMWLQRYREAEEYLQPISSVKTRWWDIGVPSLKIEFSSSISDDKDDDALERKNCNQICAREGLVCRDDAYQWSIISDCDALGKLVESRLLHNNNNNNMTSSTFCKKCTFMTDGTDLPYFNPQTKECFVHSFYAQKFQPRCDAALAPHHSNNNHHHHNRLVKFCPCVLKKEQNATAVVRKMIN